MMKKPIIAWILVLIFLLSASLACSLGFGHPAATPIPTVVASLSAPSETPQSLQEVIETAIPATPGLVKVTLTDAQLTDFVQQELNKQSEPLLTDPQVHAHDEVIDISGKAQQGPISGNVKITLTPSVDQDGKPNLKIKSAAIGALPIPQTMLGALSSLMDQAISQNADPSQTGFTLHDIQVQDGSITIQGVTQ